RARRLPQPPYTNFDHSSCEKSSSFRPTFGQYIGQTPEDERDRPRNADWWARNRYKPCELVFRAEMRETPPHILLTNYSMLEYLLIRPSDSRLFDDGRGAHWKFLVLDEAHQYRGAKGMEMGMLIRRLKQRLRDGGRQGEFRCMATSATLSAGEGEKDQQVVARFAGELFGERFSEDGIVFGKSVPADEGGTPRRYHAFLRALEGAFLVHRDGEDAVVLNRGAANGEGPLPAPLEIALCRECGQHYYVGRLDGGYLREAVRDPSHPSFGVDYYLPVEDGELLLCRTCGKLKEGQLACDCEAVVRVRKCENREDHADQLKQCGACGYTRGGIGDPVQEIVHGSDGPNAVIATALHELLPQGRRRVLAFADSRQEAAFFAWYVQDSYEKLRDRNLILRAINAGAVALEGLSIDDLGNRLLGEWTRAGLFRDSPGTGVGRNRRVQTAILREALTDEKRLSLAGVGLVQWFVDLPGSLQLPESMQSPPWSFTEDEARRLTVYLLDELRNRYAMNLPAGTDSPQWRDVSPDRPQWAYAVGKPDRKRRVAQWGHVQSAVVRHFLYRLLADSGLSDEQKRAKSQTLMNEVWRALRRFEGLPLLTRGEVNGTFRLNPDCLRVKPAPVEELRECDTCATLTSHDIRGVCPRYRCPGTVRPVDEERLQENHYRRLHESGDLPPTLVAEEHTAQIDSDEARRRQDRFKREDDIHLLSSSTTFEVGVDLGDLDVVFLRNVPPEPFNYTQRVGRAGRRGGRPGLALTYCRRNPHDLYHYKDPERSVIAGEVQSPRLRMTNEKIVGRHMAATALSAFFRENEDRFRHVADFVEDWQMPRARLDLRAFCDGNRALASALRAIVPEDMHGRIGLEGTDSWVDRVAGIESRLAEVEAEVCCDWLDMDRHRTELFNRHKSTGRVEARLRTIGQEQALNFLSRKAVIPKYGFPVDVVELDTHASDGNRTGVALQRDLSQAIAEYAPGGKVVARKLEWESCGVKVVAGKALPVRLYRYSDALDFRQWNEGEPGAPKGARRYLIPRFGFVTPLFRKPKAPSRRARRLYTTRPFFRGFASEAQPETRELAGGVRATKAQPGTLVILCEGRQRSGFYICLRCGAHQTDRKSRHKSPAGRDCEGSLEWLSLGHELVTDVLRLQFPELEGEREAYSVAYAALLGAAERLRVPNTDLNVTITRGAGSGAAIVLYDDVPGGAGLVAQLEDEDLFIDALQRARARVEGDCGCDSSCYGCLRSYRNQFAHPYLDRKKALEIIKSALR
ncbi:MAG: DUF1998 domain-containing protein, partial [Acidobacteriota bacterium]|nr:DUF1998 domain-containing protein [Acidobacteriota bacterium]